MRQKIFGFHFSFSLLFIMEIVYNLCDLAISSNSDNVLTALARVNCLNLANQVNLNKYRSLKSF
jgi:hypothetical protein